MEEIMAWQQKDSRALSSGVDQTSADGSSDLSHRAQVLKDLALALLNEVQTLGEVQSPDMGGGIDFYDEVRRFEIELIKRALKKTGGHQMRAARLLSVKVTTLNSMIKRYNICPEPEIYNYPSVETRLENEPPLEEIRKRA